MTGSPRDPGRSAGPVGTKRPFRLFTGGTQDLSLYLDGAFGSEKTAVEAAKRRIIETAGSLHGVWKAQVDGPGVCRRFVRVNKSGPPETEEVSAKDFWPTF